jgi:hypothetical protein
MQDRIGYSKFIPRWRVNMPEIPFTIQMNYKEGDVLALENSLNSSG